MSARIAIHCTPGSKTQSVSVLPDGGFAVRVTARPEDGKANEAVRRVVAKAAGVPRSAVSVVSGRTSRDKVIAVEGIGKDELRDALTRAAREKGGGS